MALHSSHAQGSVEVELQSTTPAAFDPGQTYQAAKEGIVRDFTVQYLLQRLREGEGNITKAAALSGMLRPNFKKLMTKYGVKVEDALEMRVQG